MIVRDPLVYATFYYLRESADDSTARRADRYTDFSGEVQRMAHTVAGWLSLPEPDVPQLDSWSDGEPSRELQPLMQAQTLHGRTNASAVLRAYALRNMLLLRVIVARGGEHEPSVWSMLDEVLGPAPTAESWLSTTRYWCAVAPRMPEDLAQTRVQPMQASFGVLSLGHGTQAHVLVYPDARTETRANTFLSSLAPRLDWYPVQASYHMDTYAGYVANVARRQQQALDRVAHSAQTWTADNRRDLLRSLAPLVGELDALEGLHHNVSGDLAATHGAVRELRSLAADYRLELMQSGLWSAAPMVWQAEVATLAAMEDQIASDVEHVETTLRRIEFLLSAMQTRIAVQQSERARLFAYVLVLLVATMLLVLFVDADPLRLAVRLGVLALLALAGWGGWQVWQWRTQQNNEPDTSHESG